MSRKRAGLAALAGLLLVASAPAYVHVKPTATQKFLVRIAGELLDESQISYVYGGFQVGDGKDCEQCNICLARQRPAPKARLGACPVCAKCSLDCSHFTELVYRQAGLPYPYLATPAMIGLDARTLRERYGLVDLGTDMARAAAGDLLVYDGHVVMLERRREPQGGQAYRGDIVHATGGKEIRRPGEGIQRERFIDISGFRGPLRRILRHAALAKELAGGEPALPASATEPPPAPASGLRRIPKKP